MKNIIQFAAMLLIGSSIVIATVLINNAIKEPTTVEKIIEKPTVIKNPTCESNFDSYKKLIDSDQSIKLIKTLNTYAAYGKFVNNKIVSVVRSGNGEIACGYLYVKARIGNQKLNEKYDSIYINPQEFGGHMLRSKSIPLSSSSLNATELLLPLEAVSYLPSVPYNPDAQNPQLANWVKLLNVSNRTKFNIGFSTLNSKGVIEEIVIAYKCWNSDSGKESNDCQLSVE